jgi:hypothetical protein
LTGQFGFIMGAFVGLAFYFVSIGQITFTPAPSEALTFSKNLIRSVAIASTLLTFLIYAKKKSVLGTTVDGFVTGFASIVDLITLMT